MQKAAPPLLRVMDQEKDRYILRINRLLGFQYICLIWHAQIPGCENYSFLTDPVWPRLFYKQSSKYH